MQSVHTNYYDLKRNWIKVTEKLKTKKSKQAQEKSVRDQYLTIIFLLTVSLQAAVLIWADSSRSNLDVALRQLASCPDGRITCLKLQIPQKTWEEILTKRISNRTTIYVNLEI